MNMLHGSRLHGFEESDVCLTLVRQIKEQNWKSLSVIPFCVKKQQQKTF